MEKKTITLEELSATLGIMFTKFPHEVKEMGLTYKDGVLEIKLAPVVGIENIEVNFTVEKTDINKVAPPPPPPPPEFLKVREGLPQTPKPTT